MITKDSTRFILPTKGPWSYEQQSLGFNYRMNDIQAAGRVNYPGLTRLFKREIAS